MTQFAERLVKVDIFMKKSYSGIYIILGGVCMKLQLKSEIRATESFINIVAKCLSNAVGDDIKLDMQINNLRTYNSKHNRIWDFINTNICNSFDERDVIANPTKRGGWELVPIFERSTGTIYSLMREKRFDTLKKELPKRCQAHYIDALVRSFNPDLLAPTGQGCLFSVPSFNENKVKEIVQGILSDLKIQNQIVRRHAIILFSSNNYELTRLRCCIVDSNLDVVATDDWSSYITASEGIVPDIVHNSDDTNNFTFADLAFRQKAKDKLGQKNLTNIKTKEKSSNSNIDKK